MKAALRRVVTCALLAGAVAGPGRRPLAAQSAGREPAVVELPASTRAAALGGAFQLGASDSDIVFYNPGLVGRASGMMLGWQRYGAAATGFTLSAGTSWFGGGVAVGLQALEYGGDGPGARSGGVDPILAGGDVGTAELVASVAYARRVGPVQAGVAGKFLSQRFGATHATRGAVDVGVARQIGPLQVGLAVRNLGPRYVVGDVEASQPAEVSVGAGGYGRPLGPLDVGLAAAVTRRADGEWIGGGGVELGYWPVRGRTFVIRFGGRRVPEGDAFPLTFGGSFWGDDLVVEYAFEPVEHTEGIHRVSLGWR